MMKHKGGWFGALLLVAACTSTPSGVTVTNTAEGTAMVSAVVWVNAPPGKLPYDSLTVKVVDLTGGWLPQLVFQEPFPAAAIFQQPVPSPTATYRVVAQVCVYQADRFACADGQAMFPTPPDPGTTP